MRVGGSGLRSQNTLQSTRASFAVTVALLPLYVQAWGHSSVVSPFGEVLATTDHEPAIVTCTLDLSEVDERKRNMPLTQ